jgi:putative mRNA 3-end processing factor
MVELEVEGKRILYTGDFNTLKTRLVHEAKIPRRRYDAVIIESTYARRRITPRGGASRRSS